MTCLLKKTFCAAALALAAAAAHAGPAAWTLSGVAFTDGGLASGWFVWDAVTKEYGDFDIQASDGNNMACFQDLFDSPRLAWAGHAWETPRTAVVFSSALIDAGGMVSLRDGDECSDIPSTDCRWVTMAAAVAEQLPEPASLARAGAALVGVAAVRRGRPGRHPVPQGVRFRVARPARRAFNPLDALLLA